MATTNWETRHTRQMAKYSALIDEVYKEAAREAAAIGVSLGDVTLTKAFSFDDYPQTRKRVETLLKTMQQELQVAVENGIRASWALANEKDDDLVQQAYGGNTGELSDRTRARYYTSNEAALAAFVQRKESGLSLSDRVWNYTNQFKEEIEQALYVDLGQGLSADEMSRNVRQYLKYPDKLFRRVRDKDGELHLSKAAQAYHPGQGVYRSSYKNARRLAATECNIAYRTADYLRWQELDFVVGIEIGVSATNHEPDICDELAGRYPKDFKFTGWHPHCRCHALTLLKSQEEMREDNQRIMDGEEPAEGSVNSVSEVPEVFNDWVAANKERAKGWSSMPYFIRQNPQYVQGFEVDTYTAAERKFTRARRTNEAMEESLGVYLQSKYPSMPNTEKAAIYHYTQGEGATFRQLNNQLRRGSLSEFNEAFSTLLSKGLSKLETTTETVYRSVRLNRTRLTEFLSLASKRGTTTFRGYTSTSLDSDVALEIEKKRRKARNNESDVLLVIRGKSGHPIEDFSQFSGRFEGKPNQREVLFNRNCRFRFDKFDIEGGKYIFYLTEI